MKFVTAPWRAIRSWPVPGQVMFSLFVLWVFLMVLLKFLIVYPVHVFWEPIQYKIDSTAVWESRVSRYYTVAIQNLVRQREYDLDNHRVQTLLRANEALYERVMKEYDLPPYERIRWYLMVYINPYGITGRKSYLPDRDKIQDRLREAASEVLKGLAELQDYNIEDVRELIILALHYNAGYSYTYQTLKKRYPDFFRTSAEYIIQKRNKEIENAHAYAIAQNCLKYWPLRWQVYQKFNYADLKIENLRQKYFDRSSFTLNTKHLLENKKIWTPLSYTERFLKSFLVCQEKLNVNMGCPVELLQTTNQVWQDYQAIYELYEKVGVNFKNIADYYEAANFPQIDYVSPEQYQPGLVCKQN